jgi:magnesium transporter
VYYYLPDYAIEKKGGRPYMSESRFYHISPAGELTPIVSLTEALSSVADGGYIWLDYVKPTREELSALIDPLGIHPLAIEDCTDENQVPKIEDFPQNTFIIFNAFSHTNRTLSVDEVDFFIGKDFLITVSRYGSEAVWTPSDIERLIKLDFDSSNWGPAFLMHIIMDHVVDQKFVAIEVLEDELDTAEDAMMAAPSDFDPSKLLDLRRNLLALRKSLFHEREILVKICRKDCPFIPEKAIFHYRDIYDHLATFFELTETYRDIVTSLMELYMSILNNQMTKTANETNATVRRLTYITTIFMPLTLLAGIGGMSEWSMMTGPANWKIAYPLFVAAMAVIGVANYFLLKRLDKKGRGGRPPAVK